MAIHRSGPNRVWTVAEAKAKLSEILRLAEEEGPQRIGKRKSFIIMPASAWEEKTQPRKHFGRWLVENVPRGTNLEVPSRSSNRKIPFVSDDDESSRKVGAPLGAPQGIAPTCARPQKVPSPSQGEG